MQATRHFLTGGPSISAKQGELLAELFEIIESLTETGPLGIAKIPRAGFVIPYTTVGAGSRSLARVKGVTRTESFVRNTDPPLTYPPTYPYVRARILSGCLHR